MTTLRRTLRKRSRAEAQLDSPETEAEGDDEDLVEAPLRHRQPSNVVDLTTTDEEDEMVTASEGPSSDIEPDSAEDAGELPLLKQSKLWISLLTRIAATALQTPNIICTTRPRPS